MKTLVKVSGKVSAIQADTTVLTSTSVDAGTNTSGSTTTVRNTTMFRIDNRPARMNIRLNIANGDEVTAACYDKGELEIWAIKNHTTKTMYWLGEPPAVSYVLFGFGILIGILTISIGIGILSLAYSAYEIWKATTRKNTVRAAKRIIQAA